MARAAAAGGKGGGGATARGRQAPNLVGFFNEARSELRKVTWPTRQETMNLTGAVIAMTVGMAAFLGLIDGLLDLIIKPLIGAQ
jgi:preprotein translocase subunit SecE